jgi:hypothetical protein
MDVPQGWLLWGVVRPTGGEGDRTAGVSDNERIAKWPWSSCPLGVMMGVGGIRGVTLPAS